MVTVAIVSSLLGLLIFGIPVAFALGALGLLLLELGGFSPLIVASGILSSIDSFVLISVPLFLLMSHILLRGGVGRDLFDSVNAWIGHWPGGVAVGTVLSCGLFASISGSSVATAATIATVAVPELARLGYPRNFVLGILAAGGTLGILIPPSIPMIVYGVITEESVLKLFQAGIGPGLLLIVLFSSYAVIYSLMSKSYVPSPKADWQRRRVTSLRALPTVLLGAIVVVGLYVGIFTPTEASAVGVLGALIVTGPILRTLTFESLRKASEEAAITTVAILLIIAGANVFGRAITLYRIPQEISQYMIENFSSTGAFMLVVTGVLLVIGLFLEALSMMLIMVPVLIGALSQFGVDPVWFGVYFVMMTEVALITPPVGLNLFIIQAVAKASMSEVSRGVIPFVVLMLAAVALCYFVPAVIMAIPFGM